MRNNRRNQREAQPKSLKKPRGYGPDGLAPFGKCILLISYCYIKLDPEKCRCSSPALRRSSTAATLFSGSQRLEYLIGRLKGVNSDKESQLTYECRPHFITLEVVSSGEQDYIMSFVDFHIAAGIDHFLVY